MHIISNIDQEIIRFLSENNATILEQAQAKVDQMKRNEMLSKHPYSIWEQKRNGASYYVTYVDTNAGRKQILRRSKKKLEDYIIQKIKENEVVTISQLFDEFLTRKIQNDDIKPSTIHRYRNVFSRHYVSTGMAREDIRKLDAEDISDFIEDEIGRCGLDSKGLSNLKGITTGILKRAMKRHLISYGYSTVYDFIDCKPKKKMPDPEKEVLSENEVKAFIQYVMQNKSVFSLSLLFMLVTGLRVGEMVTLRFDDFESATKFKVQRTETFYKKNNEWIYEVSDRPKTTAGVRTAFLPSQYAWIVKELRALHPFAEYLATDDQGNRIRSYRLRNHLYGICRKLPEFDREKSTHRMRKTFCSILLDHGFDANLITSIVGHTSILTTESYYHYDRKTAKAKQELLDNIVDFKDAVNT